MQENKEKKLFDIEAVKAYLKDPKKVIDLVKTLTIYVLIYVGFLWAGSLFEITPENVQATLAGKGALLVPIMIGAQLLASLTPLPDLPFNAVAILFFTPLGAFTIIYTGMWMGTIANFYIARRLGKEFVQKKYPMTADWLNRFTGKYWFESIAAGRLFTLATFDLMAYAAGISTISFKKFAFASLFGLIPVSLNATLVGLAFTTGDLGKTAFYFAVAMGLAVLIGLFGKFFRTRWEKRGSKSSQA